MESIVLLVLFGIVSSVIQAVIKNTKQQQKQIIANVNGVKLNVKPKNEEINKYDMGIEPTMVQAETRIEAVQTFKALEKEEMSASAPSFSWTENITFDELQRSIVMAEVLGKPKALRKAIR